MITIFIDQVLTKKNKGKNSEYTAYTVNKNTMGEAKKKKKMREKNHSPAECLTKIKTLFLDAGTCTCIKSLYLHSHSLLKTTSLYLSAKPIY